MEKLKLGLPSGSLQASTFAIFEKAGFQINHSGRSCFPTIDDPDINLALLRPQEIPLYVAQGALDMGISGWDWITETRAKVKMVAELVYAKQGFRPVRWVLAVPRNSTVRAIVDLSGKLVATEAVKLTRNFFRQHRVSARIITSAGATEAKPALGLVDAIVDITETGSSLHANDLVELATVFESTTRLIANQVVWRDVEKRKKVEELQMLLESVIAATSRVTLSMNVPANRLGEIKNIFSNFDPTISPLSGGGYDVIVVVKSKEVRNLLPRLKNAGATAILELPINKFVE